MNYNEAALGGYNQARQEIQSEIEKLQDMLADYDKKCQYIDWTNVGDMRRVLGLLKLINGEE